MRYKKFSNFKSNSIVGCFFVDLYYNLTIYRAVAQSRFDLGRIEDPRFCFDKIGIGSAPRCLAGRSWCINYRAVAQLVARLHGVQEVAGSNPVSPTKESAPRCTAGRPWVLGNTNPAGWRGEPHYSDKEMYTLNG